MLSGSVHFQRKFKRYKRWLWLLAFIFLLMNGVSFFHAYRFTHFVDEPLERTKDPLNLSVGAKLKALFMGVNNPRPVNDSLPQAPFETVFLNSNRKIECWDIQVINPKGTVVLFHGYAGHKSSLLDRAEIFRSQGYQTFLVDFMGSGGSEGNQTTIGYQEAEEVKTVFDYLKSRGDSNIVLYGTSMGSVAIMRAVGQLGVQPQGIILECPFGTMYQTVCARFRTMHVPTFPMAGMLVFWGGVQNGFWAFGHNPETYAGQITCPTLLMYGQKDEKVSQHEIDAIYSNLKGPKELHVYPHAGHENYIRKYRAEWTRDVAQFLEAYSLIPTVD